MLTKFNSDKINGTKNALFFFFVQENATKKFNKKSL